MEVVLTIWDYVYPGGYLNNLQLFIEEEIREGDLSENQLEKLKGEKRRVEAQLDQFSKSKF